MPRPWPVFNVTPSGSATCEVLGSGPPHLAGPQWVSVPENSSTSPNIHTITSPLISNKKRERRLFLGTPQDSTEAEPVQQQEAEGGRASRRRELLPDLIPPQHSPSRRRATARTGVQNQSSGYFLMFSTTFPKNVPCGN